MKKSEAKLKMKCLGLQKIIDIELQNGNTLLAGPEQSNWPVAGAFFAHLKFELSISIKNLPAGVSHSICTDPHFGWHDECRCVDHGDLLVAGSTRLPK